MAQLFPRPLPDSVLSNPLLSSEIRVYEALGEQLDDGSTPAWQYNLLGARALAALNRWPEAKSAAEAALAENPNFPQAHLLLGQVYEHAGDWPRAAAEYRAASGR